jgi:hypothetical protein
MCRYLCDALTFRLSFLQIADLLISVVSADLQATLTPQTM